MREKNQVKKFVHLNIFHLFTLRCRLLKSFHIEEETLFSLKNRDRFVNESIVNIDTDYRENNERRTIHNEQVILKFFDKN